MRAVDFLKEYFNDDEYFIITRKYPKNNGKVKHYQTMVNIKDISIEKRLGKFHYLNRDKNVDIYFTLNSYHFQKSYYPSRKEEYVKTIKSFYFDIDKGDIELKKLNIIKIFGIPTYIIETSKGKFQFIYKFKEPIIIYDFSDIEYFKQLLKGLLYYFDVDKTFDSARIFRLVGYMNKKQGNNDFIVKIQKNNYYYTFQEFENIAKDFLLPIKQTKKRVSNSKSVSKSKSKTSNKNNKDTSNFDKYKNITRTYNKKYIELLNKYKEDYSTADISYARWLYFRKNLNDDEIIEKIFKVRGYNHIIEKHDYQINYYFENILDKCKLIL